MHLGLEDKVVFVAGASRGIGKGIASVFLDEGARVTLTGRDREVLAAAGAELSEGRADRVMTFAGDLTQAAVVEEAHRRVIRVNLSREVSAGLAELRQALEGV